MVKERKARVGIGSNVNIKRTTIELTEGLYFFLEESALWLKNIVI